MTACIRLLAFLFSTASMAQEPPPAAMLRFPDVSETHIVFSYANDLWLVDREGGWAAPLSSPAGQETMPRFSPDGQTIAFSGNYEGNVDLYTIPLSGGRPERVTFHPAGESLCDWTPDGQLVYSTAGFAGLRRTPQLFAVPATGGLATRLPMPYGTNATVSPDGMAVAYTPYSRDQRTWKRYQGGMASDVWIFHLDSLASERITEWAGTDSIPMWFGQKIYYLSDAGPHHRLNIWCYDIESKRHEAITAFADHDVKWPSLGPGPDGQGEIVFQLGADLHLLDLQTRADRKVVVRIPGDRAEPRRQSVDASKNIQSFGISSTGKRAVVEARGDIWTLPAENGPPRNLTHSDDSAERSPAWSPDGRWIAYFGDATGEYELYVTQSDGKGREERLTSDGSDFRSSLTWSPDSQYLVFSENSGAIQLFSRETGELKEIDRNPMGGGASVSWSHDSRWLTYSRPFSESLQSAVYLYNVEEGEAHQVTAGMFSDGSPAFDRAGNYLYFASSRSFQPQYSSIDSTFIYPDSQLLMAVPLRTDVEYPWLPESDEEEWDEESADDEDAAEESSEDGADESADAADSDDADEESSEDAAPDDGVSGHWDGKLSGGPIPPPGVDVWLDLTLEDGGKVTGTAGTPAGTASLDGTFDAASGAFRAETTNDEGNHSQIDATIQDGSMTGSVSNEQGTFQLTADRTSTEAGGGSSGETEEVQEVVEIDLEGFEARAFPLPVSAGSFRNLRVNDKGALLYVRGGGRGGSSTIQLFDIKDDDKNEKQVAAGGAFDMSADGKKILVARGNSGTIQDASAGSSGKALSTNGMITRIDPRREWRQILVDAWRMERQFFYDPHMHGVDWDGVLRRYLPMVDHCSSRADLTFVIGELIGELNAGHAYVRPSPEQERGSRVAVGLLGVDFEMHGLAYRIQRILEGAPWDVDARNPLRRQGVDVKEGEYLLAVNGVELDISQSPYAAFVGLAGQPTALTVSEKPFLDETAREVLVTPMGSEGTLRYRAWIESNRRRVEERSEGRLGYVYVPDTGVNGQNDLFRQFYGQIGKQGLIIDDRWNGGGQIPTRFIELLNRPATNQWALRSGAALPWPYDSHQGAKCMLINGLAGSGGDAFPAYFRQAGPRQTHRHADLGRPHRHLRRPGPGGRRRRHGSFVRLLRERRHLGHRRSRSGTRHRGDRRPDGSRPGQRSATGCRHRSPAEGGRGQSVPAPAGARLSGSFRHGLGAERHVVRSNRVPTRGR